MERSPKSLDQAEQQISAVDGRESDQEVREEGSHVIPKKRRKRFTKFPFILKKKLITFSFFMP
jgi:hypothetical protein